MVAAAAAAASSAANESLSSSLKLWAQSCVRKAKQVEHNLEYKRELETSDYDVVAQQLLLAGYSSNSSIHSSLKGLETSPKSTTQTKFAHAVLHSLFEHYKSIVLNECEEDFAQQSRRGHSNCRMEFFERVTFDSSLSSDVYTRRVASQAKYAYDAKLRALSTVRSSLRTRSVRESSNWMPSSAILQRSFEDLVHSVRRAEADLSNRQHLRAQLASIKRHVKTTLEDGVLRLQVCHQKMQHLQALEFDSLSSSQDVRRVLLEWLSSWIDCSSAESQANLKTKANDELADVQRQLDTASITDSDEILALAARKLFDCKQQRNVELAMRNVANLVRKDVLAVQQCKDPALADALQRLSSLLSALPSVGGTGAGSSTGQGDNNDISSTTEPSESQAVATEQKAFERAAHRSAKISAKIDIWQTKEAILRRIKANLSHKRMFSGLTGAWRRSLLEMLDVEHMTLATQCETPALASFSSMLQRLSEECEASTPESRKSLMLIPLSCKRAYEVVLRLVASQTALLERKIAAPVRVPSPLDEAQDFELPQHWIEQLLAINNDMRDALLARPMVKLSDVAAASAEALNCGAKALPMLAASNH